ncbi:neurotrypsin-like [Amphiura filiformis]|uniref:neurotrypsin-like n=1 Tax=Amphiura filiformis TaxID=82378 RepID=UPI003B2135AD
MTVGRCNENENLIQRCQSSSLWGASSCPYSAILLAVVCNDSTPMPRPTRLAGSSLPTEGRLEILGLNGEWGRVCSPRLSRIRWDGKSAEVACRQLGFTKWSHHLAPGAYGEGSGQILLTGADCNGTESDLESCDHYMWGYLNIPGDRCYDITLACDVPTHISLRLVGGSAPTRGILQVSFNGLAGNICNKSWDHNDTLVACRQLGFVEGFSYAAPLELFDTEARAWTFWLEDIGCKGDESNIQDCPHSAWGDQLYEGCKEGAEVAIVCNEPIPEVRLVGGKTSKEGLLQIKFRGDWGYVCASSEEGTMWTDVESNVVCHQLGYDGWAFAVASELFGIEFDLKTRHSLKKVRCDGHEEALVLCRHTPNWVDDICPDYVGHGEYAAAVICVEDQFGVLSTTSTPNFTPEIEDGMSLGLVSSSNTSMIIIVFVIVICILVIVLLVVLVMYRRKTHSYITTGKSDCGDAGEEEIEGPPGESRL